MPRKRAESRPVKLGITISQQMSEYLDELVVVGLYGKTPTEVATNLVGRQIEEFLGKDKLLKKPESKTQ